MQPSSSQSPSDIHPNPNNSATYSPPLKRSDLGSDEEWHLTMASDSDLEEPEQSSPNPTSSSSQAPHSSSDNLDLRAQRHNSDEENYIDDIKQPVVPNFHSHLVQNRPATDPPRLDSNHYSTTIATHFDRTADISTSLHPPPTYQHHPEPALDTQEADHNPDDQLVLIPGYRGSSSREAVANQPAQSPNSTESQLPSATNPNRTNPVPLASKIPCTDPSSSQISLSDQTNPSQSQTTSTSTTTHTDKKQDSNSTSLHPPKPSQPVDQRAPSPSLDLHRKPTEKPLLQEQATHATSTTTSSSIPTTTTPDSVRNDSRRTSGILATLRDSTARVTAARLSATYHQSQAQSSQAQSLDSTIYGSRNPNNNLFYPREPNRNLFVPLRQSPHYQIDATAASRNPGYHYLNATAEDDPHRRESDLAQASVHLGGPSNPALYAGSAADFVTPGASSSTMPSEALETMFPSSVEPSHLPTRAGRARFKPATRSTKDLSFLECVVEILKGCDISRRRYLLSTIEGEIWLTSDMKAIQYRMFKKGHAATVQSIILDHVRMVRGSERELTIEVINKKKPVQFIFRTQARAETWLSALSCIVPRHTVVMLRHKKLEMRERYDPVRDTWNGKPVAAKKQLNEFIILGTIGKGSFGKVKLALSRQDGKFYALKVIQKTIMLKRMGIYLHQRGRNGGGTQLTFTDVNEIDVMNGLEHENVIRCNGVFDAALEDRLYIKLEFLPRGPIMRSTETTAKQRIAEDKARIAFADVLSGLQYLHSKNIVHGDIKPDNLLQAGDGTVKISDFGAAIKYSGETANQSTDDEHYRQTMGTPAFSAPEICLYENSPPRPARRFAADIWSLGATLYYMVFGRVPFPATRIFQLYADICTEPLSFPRAPATSKNLRNLLEQMMQKLPEQRATIRSIVESPWLTECPEVSEKVEKIRNALSKQSNGTSTERQTGLPSQPETSVPPR